MQECYDCGNGVMNSKAIPYQTKEGKLYKCLVCYQAEPKLQIKQECQIYSRVCGYLQPVSGWNPGKRSEKRQRKTFKFE